MTTATTTIIASAIALPTFSWPRMTSELMVPAICSGNSGVPCEMRAFAVA